MSNAKDELAIRDLRAERDGGFLGGADLLGGLTDQSGSLELAARGSPWCRYGRIDGWRCSKDAFAWTFG